MTHAGIATDHPRSVVLFDGSAAWTAFLLRSLAGSGYPTRQFNLATGFEMASWSTTCAALFDLSRISDVGRSLRLVVGALMHLRRAQPQIGRLVLNPPHPSIEWLVREAGADSVHHSLLDVPSIVRQIRQIQLLERKT